jgi:signal transduction histidine kinase
LALKYNQVKLEKVLERERLLNKMVEERTSDLNKEKEKTEKLLLESEKSKNQLQAANELKSQLLSIAAHDLKNPLQVILGYEFYKEDMTLTDEEEEMLNSIFHAAKKMLGMISETLESAAADAAQLELNLVDTDLAELLNSSVNDQKILAKRKEQKIITEIEYDIEKVKLDKFWFREAIDNLISNAIKYSPKKSEIKVKLETNYNDIKLTITDNGPGFTEDDKSRLFAKFQRLSAKPTAGESSTGLGLFIVKQIIDKHKFSIELDSKQNKGSSFQIIIPQNI